MSSDVGSSFMKELLKDFLPDDVCPLGLHLSMETQGQICQISSEDSKSPHEVVHPTFSIDDDNPPETFGSQTDAELQHTVSNLVNVDQFMDSVSETTNQVGRLSISAPSNIPYKEMASHCEAFLMGKQQKMSTFISAQQIQEKSMGFSDDNYNQSENPFLYDDSNAVSFKQPVGTAMHCSTEYQQHPHYMRLPCSRTV